MFASHTHWIAAGCISALISVMAGAFGAHALAEKLSERMLSIFQTGAQYQMYHSLALVAFGLWIAHSPVNSMSPGWAFLTGIFLFSGSLYVLALSGITWLGAITPFGGTAFMVGWALFAWQVLKQ